MHTGGAQDRHSSLARECDQQRAKWLPTSCLEHRAGRHEATRINKSILTNESKHGTEVGQEHSYAHETAKRDISNQRGEHICTVKYDMFSKISSHTNDSKNHLFSHNSNGTCYDRIQHGQYHKTGISELFPTREHQPSAEGLIEQKPNSFQIAECKTNILDFVDCKQHSIDFVHHLPIITDLVG